MNLKSKLCIGTLPWGGYYGKCNFEELKKILRFIKNNDIKFIDTAPSYGDCEIEKIIGEYLGSNKDFKINTKIGGFAKGFKSFKINDLNKSFFQSLKRLKREQINILYLHNPRKEIKDMRKVLEYMKGLKERGYIRYTGISLASNFDYQKKHLLNQFDFIQDDVNLLSLPRFLKFNFKKTKIVARSPLASGILSPNYEYNKNFKKNDDRSNWLYGDRKNAINERIKIIKSLYDYDILKLALLFVFSLDNISFVNVGCRNLSQLKKIINYLSCKKISKNEINKLISLQKKDFGLKNKFHLNY